LFKSTVKHIRVHDKSELKKLFLDFICMGLFINIELYDEKVCNTAPIRLR